MIRKYIEFRAIMPGEKDSYFEKSVKVSFHDLRTLDNKSLVIKMLYELHEFIAEARYLANIEIDE